MVGNNKMKYEKYNGWLEWKLRDSLRKSVKYERKLSSTHCVPIYMYDSGKAFVTKVHSGEPPSTTQ